MTTVRSGDRLLASSSTSTPSMPGILTSSSMRWKDPVSSTASASAPDAAMATVYPSSSSHSFKESRTTSSSSTTRMRNFLRSVSGMRMASVGQTSLQAPQRVQAAVSTT